MTDVMTDCTAAAKEAELSEDWMKSAKAVGEVAVGFVAAATDREMAIVNVACQLKLTSHRSAAYASDLKFRRRARRAAVQVTEKSTTLARSTLAEYAIRSLRLSMSKLDGGAIAIKLSVALTDTMSRVVG